MVPAERHDAAEHALMPRDVRHVILGQPVLAGQKRHVRRQMRQGGAQRVAEGA